MSRVKSIAVETGDDGIRLDRWFRNYFPGISHGRLQKLLRTGQVRVDGGRVKAGNRLSTGQIIRVPPISKEDVEGAKQKVTFAINEQRAKDLRRRVIYHDENVLVVNKPSGLAVQGGTKTNEHLDGYLDALRFDATERPKLVHRLDKDTSGTIVLARHTKAARWLTAAFKKGDAQKLYWAVVAGLPYPRAGSINAPLKKSSSKAGENMVITRESDGMNARTLFHTVAHAGNSVAWLAMEPLTGRTHQLRVHCAAVLETPILGDGKYGGREAFLEANGLSRELHLHARGIRINAPHGKQIEVFAPLPDQMVSTFGFFEFDQASEDSGFLT